MFAAPMFSSSRFSFVVPGIGSPGLLSEDPREGDLRRRGFLTRGNALQEFHYGLIRLPSFWYEPGHDVPKVRAVELRVLVDLPREKTLPQRAERHKANSEFLKRGDDLGFRLAPPERVLALESGQRLNGVSTPDRLRSSLGKAEMLYLSFLDKVLHRAGDIFNRRLRIDAMLIK